MCVLFQGGFITTSEVKVVLRNDDDDVMYECQAINQALTTRNPATAAVTLQVMYPPGTPVISGFTSGREVTAGDIQVLSCASEGGNPLATLSWWKGETKKPKHDICSILY